MDLAVMDAARLSKETFRHFRVFHVSLICALTALTQTRYSLQKYNHHHKWIYKSSSHNCIKNRNLPDKLIKTTNMDCKRIANKIELQIILHIETDSIATDAIKQYKETFHLFLVCLVNLTCALIAQTPIRYRHKIKCSNSNLNYIKNRNLLVRLIRTMSMDYKRSANKIE